MRTFSVLQNSHFFILPVRRAKEFPQAAFCIFAAFRIAAQTAGGVAGMAKSSLPIASVIALTTAAGAAIAPASPQPLMPSGFDGHFVIVVSTFSDGKFSARGMV